MTAENKNSQNTEKKSRTLDVIDWVNINLLRWEFWGFDNSDVFRTPRYSFLVQPVKSVLREVTEPIKSLELTGLWYHLDDEIERKLEKVTWAAWFLAVIILSLALFVYTMDMAMLSFALFIVMFIIVEGFMAVIYKIYASDRYRGNIEIKFESLKKAILFKKPGILMISWEDDDRTCGVACKMSVNVSEALFERIKLGASESADISIDTHSNPMVLTSKKR